MQKNKLLILLLIVFFQLVSCQERKNMRGYNVEISHPSNDYEIEPVVDKIITLENTNASLPYGGSSGHWGNSGATFTERVGTPIGADIVYFAVAEDTFYHLKADFPVDKMKDMVRRAYAIYDDERCYPGKEYINITEEKICGGYYPLGDLVFGFAPKGVVVVWLRYGYVQIEIGQYQAEVVEDDKKYEEKLFASWSMNRKQVREAQYIENTSPEKWINYRNRYTWQPIANSENKGFRFLGLFCEYYNAEVDMMLQPRLSSDENMRERSVPKEINIFWTTGKGEGYEGRIFFDWSETNEALQKAGSNAKMEFKIAKDNSSFKVLLNGQLLKVDSTRIFEDDRKFRDSYK